MYLLYLSNVKALWPTVSKAANFPQYPHRMAIEDASEMKATVLNEQSTIPQKSNVMRTIAWECDLFLWSVPTIRLD